MGDAAVLLVAHGTVERLDDLPAFVTNIRRGRPPSEAMLSELRARYEAIGGRSPLLDVSRELAAAVEARTGLPTRLAMRLWHPYVRDVLGGLYGEGIRRVVLVPLAQHSAHVYAEAAARDAEALSRERGERIELCAIGNWGQRPSLVAAFAAAIHGALARLPEEARGRTTVLMTAHSLPRAVIDAGDPDEREVRASAEAVAAALGPGAAARGGVSEPGFGGGAWLGPDLPEVLDRVAGQGQAHVVFAPIGFLADHVEILYDLDVEAAAWVRERGMTSSRAPSLNASPELADTIAALVAEVAPGAGRRA